jgi:hypothetical protein
MRFQWKADPECLVFSSCLICGLGENVHSTIFT